MKVSDFFDRVTILKMKSEFDMTAKQELDYIASYMINSVSSLSNEKIKDFLFALMDLSQANAKIWMLEASLRKEYSSDPSSKEKLDMEQVGKRALAIRDMNKKRLKAKEQIDLLFGDFTDKKIDHQSA